MIVRGEWRGTGPIRLHVLVDRDELLQQEAIGVQMEVYHSKQFPIIVSSTTGLSSGVDAPVLNLAARVDIVKHFNAPGTVSAAVRFPVINVPSFKTIRLSVDCEVLCDRDSLHITNY